MPLVGEVRLAAGRTLVIEAGTRVEATPGSRLVIERGASIIADGTALRPIVLTCVGSLAEPLLAPGCWGGVVLQGFAPVNGGTPSSPEAPGNGLGGCNELVSDATGDRMGGCDAVDDSGILRFVRIELAEEGLRLEGVGNGTVLEQLEVRRSRLDGVRLVGGTADLRRFSLGHNGLAGLSWTRGWTGRAQEILVLAHPLDHREAIRGENAPTLGEADRAPRSQPQLANVTIIAPSAATNPDHLTSAAIRLERGTAVRLRNALVIGPRVALDVDDAATCLALASDAFRSVVTSGATDAGDPDADAAPCAAESARLTDGAHLNQLLGADPLLLVAPHLTNTPDLRPGSSTAWSTISASPLVADGFFDVGAPYVGGVRPGANGSIPWYAGWTVWMPTAGVPIATTAQSLALMTGTAGLDVAAPPVVRATDADGLGVSDLSVSFNVISGGGSVGVASTRTDVEGYARVARWTLGPQVGPQLLTASFDGLPNVVFRATASAPPGQGWLEPVSSTDAQVGAAGAILPVAPGVIVRDPGGAPVAGVSVTFAVTSGGGTLTGANAISSASGVATVGSWRLGSTSGTQRLSVSATGRLGTTMVAQANATGVPSLVRETIISESLLEWPWDLAFAPDGTLLFTQRLGVLQVIRPGSTVAQTIAQPTDLGAEGQSGLLGLAVDPAFGANRYVYTYQSWLGASGARDNRVVRWRVAPDWSALTERTDIVTGISYNGGGHSGGRIRFGADGHLWIATGDTRIGGVPQDLSVLGGKVLRVTRDGAPAPGNPSLGAGSDPRIYAFGFRNVQGLALRSDGAMYSCEHGPVHSDEVTRLAAGGNGGWHPLRSGDPYDEYRGYEGLWPMTDSVRFPSAMRPTWSTGDPSEGMSACVFLSGAQWGAWDGALVVGLMSGFRAVVLSLSPDGRSVTGSWPLWPGTERYRGFAIGPDGALYGVSDFSGLFRIRPQ